MKYFKNLMMKTGGEGASPEKYTNTETHTLLYLFSAGLQT